MALMTGGIWKLAFGGPMPGGDEWSCGLTLIGETDQIAIIGTAADFKPAIETWFKAAASQIHAGTSLEYVKLNQLSKVTKRYLDGGNSDTSLYSPMVTHTNPHMPLPNQLTSVVSLHTEISRGRGSHGRFYPPSACTTNNGSLMGGDGRLDAATALGMANAAAALLNSINDVAETRRVGVWSFIGGAGYGVTEVSVGRVVDTQRRRRNSLDEARQFSPVAIVG